MSSRSTKSRSPADVWLIDGVPTATGEVKERTSDGDRKPEAAVETVDSQARQWLETSPLPGAPDETRRGPNPDGRASARGIRKGRSRRERRLSSRLSKAERVIEEQRDEIETLQGQISELRSELAKTKPRSSAGPKRTAGPESRNGREADRRRGQGNPRAVGEGS